MSDEGPRPLLNPSQVIDLARRHGIKPSKSLGQNFVVDANTIRRIVTLADISSDDLVLEVGAGMGALTLGLLAVGAQVRAVEFDRKLLPALEEVLSGNAEVVAADAMELDYPSLLGDESWRMVSNLPYNIATPLMAKLLEEAPQIKDFLILVQREVGERLVAEPGSKTYGGISVRVRYHGEPRMLGRVPPTVFWPVPKIDSVLVRIVRTPPIVDISSDELMAVVRAAFSQRRKTVRNSLASALGLPIGDVERALSYAGVSATARAEALGIDDFTSIAKALR